MTDTEKAGGKGVAATKLAPSKKTTTKTEPPKSAKMAAAEKKPATMAKKIASKSKAPPLDIVHETLIVVSDDERYRMIAEAAYYRAENSQFQSDPVSDWIEAEKEIAALLGKDRETR